MKKYSIHICLVSEETLANVSPVLDESFRPQKVILASSPQMEKYTRRLSEIYKQHNIDFEVWDLPDNIFDSWALLESFETLAASLRDQDACLNTTAGHRLLALTAYEACKNVNIPSFYVNALSDTILWIDKDHQDLEIEDHMNLHTFLQAQGYEVLSGGKKNISKRKNDLCEYLVEHCQRFTQAIKQLNYLCANADHHLRIDLKSSYDPHNKELQEILNRFYELKLVETNDGMIWTFIDENALSFAHGAWLEDYCYRKMTQFNDKLQDYGSSIEVLRSQSKGSKNEIDAAFLKDNRLYIIECKTSKMGNGVNILHKLESLSDLLGGTHGKGILLSFHKLPSYDLQRAKDLDIEVFDAHNLSQFPAYIDKITR